ncbi:hypothetical protein H2200_008084 [Cladophialophora chaetospira]|uniref:Uncharacterized protein n=1 Tax=Cladophialophora chaetospira TaxID=386627 RepID=A0AA39CH92_9EURO|nr:hypothetical protein H2200_008084 [Cladophialophora chaetospira]
MADKPNIKRKGDEYAPIALIKIEGTEAYEEFMRDILQYEPDSRPTFSTNGVEMTALEYYNNDSTKSTFKGAFQSVINTFETRFGIAVKLGLVICPRNLSATMKQIIPPILEQFDHCRFPNNTNPVQYMAKASGEVMMDGSCGSQRGYGIRNIHEESEIYSWFIITIVIYQKVIQILFDEGPVMDHQTFGCHCVDDVSVDEHGQWARIEKFQRAFADAIKEHISRLHFDPASTIARVVITGDIQTSAAQSLSDTIIGIAPYLQDKIQGVEELEAAFISARGAACLCYQHFHSQPRRMEMQPSSTM